MGAAIHIFPHVRSQYYCSQVVSISLSILGLLKHGQPGFGWRLRRSSASAYIGVSFHHPERRRQSKILLPPNQAATEICDDDIRPIFFSPTCSSLPTKYSIDDQDNKRRNSHCRCVLISERIERHLLGFRMSKRRASHQISSKRRGNRTTIFPPQ